MKETRPFRFKGFVVHHDQCAMKVGTDAVILGAWVDVEGDIRLLDVGTGSGVIALMLAQRTAENATIDGIEIMEADAHQARVNFKDSPFHQKLRAVLGSIQAYTSDPYDHIVTNPPYFVNSLLPPNPQRTRARHEGSLTYLELIQSAKRLLQAAGRLSLIFPADQLQALTGMAENEGLSCQRLMRIRSKPSRPVERIAATFGFEAAKCAESELVIQGLDGEFTQEYRQLTRHFYLNF